MLRRLGFVAAVLSKAITTSRTCRLRLATPERLGELIETNLASLDAAVGFLIRNRIKLYRISSGLIPFASHPVNDVPWRQDFRLQLQSIGRKLRAHDIRVSLHPGQYTVLNSPRPEVVRASIAELRYHTALLDDLGAGPASKIVLHVGGLYAGSESAALDRFVAVARELPPEVLRRLVIENDDRLFDADEVLGVARRLGVPVVFDWLHHHANPCRRPVNEVIAEVFETWRPEDGVPKLHLSTQAEGASRGAHADFVDPKDLLALLECVPDAPFDCMLEAKQKDIALLRLRRQLARRGIVETDWVRNT